MARKVKNNPYYKHMPTISVRRIIHHIMAFVLTVLIFALAASLSTVTGFLNDSAIKNAVENQEFYKSARENVIAQCQSAATPSMIDEDVFYSVFTREEIAKDVKAYLAEGVQGKEYDFDFSELKQTMAEAIKANLEQKKITVTSQMQAQIDKYCDQCLEIYSANISISYISAYAQLKGTVKPIAYLVFGASLVLIIAILFFMVAIYKFKVVHKSIRMFAYGLGGAGIMLVGIAGYFKLVRIGKGVQVLPEFVYDCIQRYIQEGLGTYIFAGVILLIFSLSLAFVSETLRSRVKRNYFTRLEANFRENLNEELENKNFTPDLDMTSREEKARKIAHDEFNRYAMDRLGDVTLNEERERTPDTEFDLPIVNSAPQDDFTEIQVDDDED